MLRIRIDGRALTTLRYASSAKSPGCSHATTRDLTDRQNIQLHWIKSKSSYQRSSMASKQSGPARPNRPGDTPRWLWAHR